MIDKTRINGNFREVVQQWRYETMIQLLSRTLVVLVVTLCTVTLSYAEESGVGDESLELSRQEILEMAQVNMGMQAESVGVAAAQLCLTTRLGAYETAAVLMYNAEEDLRTHVDSGCAHPLDEDDRELCITTIAALSQHQLNDVACEAARILLKTEKIIHKIPSKTE